MADRSSTDVADHVAPHVADLPSTNFSDPPPKVADGIPSGGSERRFPKAVAWTLFIACLVSGAALLLNDRAGLRLLGLALLVAPLAAFLALQFAYYLVERFRASR